jgi:hypothetical protein
MQSDAKPLYFFSNEEVLHIDHPPNSSSDAFHPLSGK